MRRHRTLNQKEHPQPQDLPSIGAFYASVKKKAEKNQLDDVFRAFSAKTMQGKLIIQWCGRCGAWRYQFISSTRIEEFSREREEKLLTNIEPKMFPCFECGRQLLLVIDGGHVILESK